MFSPKNENIKSLAELNQKMIQQLENFFDKNTNVYIDFANVLGWQKKLNWRIDIIRLKEFLDSFSNIKSVKFYYGTLAGDKNSERIINDAKTGGYEIITKPVKIIKIPINALSIPLNSAIILEDFIKKPLLLKFDLETIEFINSKIRGLNEQGIFYLEHRKCNFDVEIGRDIEIDFIKNNNENFALWSGDSDFADITSHISSSNKKVMLFMTNGRISSELANSIRNKNMFDIKKIKEFIAFPKDLQ